MLGIKTKRTPITGDIANNIRNAVVRVSTRHLNKQEKASKERSKKILSQHNATWIGLDGRTL